MSGVDDAEFEIVGHKVGEVRPLAGGGNGGGSREGFSAGGCDGCDFWHTRVSGVDAVRSSRGLDGGGVRVAVIDTGVYAGHPALHGKVTAHDCTGKGAGDEDGHGSHCCGIVHSVAPGADIHSFRVFEPGNKAVHRNIMRALREVSSGKHGRFDVVSMSLGGGEPSHDMRMELLSLNAGGVFICCAAGNESDHSKEDAPRFGTVNWPAHFNSTLAVGSVDRAGRRSSYSSSGPKITVMAPGEDVWSCWKDDSMACLSGTSMATPFVAGTIALLLQACVKNEVPKPNLSQLLLCVAASSSDMEAPGFDFFTGYGCINPRGLIDRYLALARAAAATRSRGA